MRMTKGKLEAVYQKNFDNRDGWKHISDYLVERYTTDIDDERKLDVSADIAVGMAMGEALSRNYHTLKGVTIGALGVGLGVILINKFSMEFKEKYGDDPDLVKETEILREKSEEVLSRHRKND